MAFQERDAVDFVIRHEYLEIEPEADRSRGFYAFARVQKCGEQMRALTSIRRTPAVGIHREQRIKRPKDRRLLARHTPGHFPLTAAQCDHDLELIRGPYLVAGVELFAYFRRQRDRIDIEMPNVSGSAQLGWRFETPVVAFTTPSSGEVFYSDSGAPYTGQINGSRQNGNPGRVAGDTRPGAVNFIAGGEASPHMFDEFQSDGRWDLGVDRLDDGRYGAVQTYSIDPETLAQMKGVPGRSQLRALGSLDLRHESKLALGRQLFEAVRLETCTPNRGRSVRAK